MIAFVKGKLEEIFSDNLIIDKDGLGFQIFTSSAVLEALPPIGSEIKLHTHFHVKEDNMQLFGFLSRGDLKLFQLLITVSGVGPKAALSILSSINSDTLIFAILSEDIKTISKAQGVGKKIAQKIILDIKDKVGALNEEAFIATQEKEDGGEAIHLHHNINEAVEVLKALGYSATESLRAVKGLEMESPASTDEIVKEALKMMN